MKALKHIPFIHWVNNRDYEALTNLMRMSFVSGVLIGSGITYLVMGGKII